MHCRVVKAVRYRNTILTPGDLSDAVPGSPGVYSPVSIRGRKSAKNAGERALTTEIDTLAALAELQHDNIVLTYGIQYGAPPGTQRESFMLLLELCSYDLGVLVHDMKPKEEDRDGWMEQCLQISQQMCAGLTFIQVCVIICTSDALLVIARMSLTDCL